MTVILQSNRKKVHTVQKIYYIYYCGSIFYIIVAFYHKVFHIRSQEADHTHSSYYLTD